MKSANSNKTPKATTLPSGPADPPVNQLGPTEDEFSKRPTPSKPLSGVP